MREKTFKKGEKRGVFPRKKSLYKLVEETRREEEEFHPDQVQLRLRKSVILRNGTSRKKRGGEDYITESMWGERLEL